MKPPTSHEDNPAVPLPPPVIFATGLVSGLVLQRLAPLPSPPAKIARPAGLGGMAAGAGLIVSGARLLRRRGTSVLPFKPATVLVENGPYRFSRNPMYVGMALVQAGLALGLRATWSLLALAPVVATMNRVVIAREESYLERRFGEEYGRYRGRVRRWL